MDILKRTVKTFINNTVFQSIVLGCLFKLDNNQNPEKNNKNGDTIDTITQKYIDWVKNNFPHESKIKSFNNFIPPDLNEVKNEEKTLDMLARFLLYTNSGYNVILDGVTGTGKTTLIEYVAQKENKPLHLIPPVKELRYSDVVGTLMEDHEGKFNYMPGPLVRFLIFGGYLGFDEMANLNSRIAIALHGLLQNKPIEVSNTQYGTINLSPSYKTHVVVGTGNFKYQKPQFNRSTLQRCVFIDVPPLNNELFINDLKSNDQHEIKFNQYEELLDQMYPWKQDSSIHPTTIDYGWLNVIDDGLKKRDDLLSLCLELREKASDFKEFSSSGLDVSNSIFKRILSLYSPNMGTESFKDIVSENLVNPIAVEYTQMDKQKMMFQEIIYNTINKYSSRLFQSDEKYTSQDISRLWTKK